MSMLLNLSDGMYDSGVIFIVIHFQIEKEKLAARGQMDISCAKILLVNPCVDNMFILPFLFSLLWFIYKSDNKPLLFCV